MKSPQNKSADTPREADEDKAAQRLAFFRKQRGIDPAPPAVTPPTATKKNQRKAQ